MLPNACETKMVVTMNARSLQNFFHLRCCNRASGRYGSWPKRCCGWSTRWHPISSAPPARPACPAPREGKMCCGRTAEVRARYAALKGEKAE